MLTFLVQKDKGFLKQNRLVFVHIHRDSPGLTQLVRVGLTIFMKCWALWWNGVLLIHQIGHRK
jgi:hypothetical protein